MFPMQLLTLEKLVAVDIFWSRLCSPKVKTKRKGDDCFVPGQGGLVTSCKLNLNPSEENMKDSPCFLFFDVRCPHAPSRCESQCFHRDIPDAKPVNC